MTKQLQAYFNNPKIKRTYVKRITCHRKADELIHGTYWENGKGCAIGCILHSSCHNKFEYELGLPEWLAYLVDFLFEGLPNGEAKVFPEQVLKSIKVGVNLDITYHKFCIFLLKEICKNTDNPLVKPSINKIIELHTRILTFNKTDVVTEKEWSAARSAWSAARSAAWSAAWSAAESAAVQKIANKLIELLKEAR